MTDIFSKRVKTLIVDDPFYGYFLSNMNREYSELVQTIGFVIEGVNIKVLINPTWAAETSEEESYKVIKRELSHLMQRHFLEDAKENATTFEDKTLANAAFELAVEKPHWSELPQVPRWYYLHLMDPDYVNPAHPGDKSLRQMDPALAAKIDEMRKKNAETQRAIDAYTAALEAAKEAFCEDHCLDYDDEDLDDVEIDYSEDEGITLLEEKIDALWEQYIDWDDILDVNIHPHLIWDQIQKMYHDQFDVTRDDYSGPAQDFDTMVTLIQDQVNFHLMSSYKNCGRCPGFMEEYIHSLLAPAKAAYDWKRAFRRMLGNSHSDQFRSSRMRCSHRFDDASGFRHVKNSKILVAVDTSGSVSSAELADFANEIHNIWKSGADITVAEGDTSIANVYPYDGKKIEKFVGRGGTNFAAMVEYWNEHCREYDGFVFMTDGEDCVKDLNPIKPMIWVISRGGYQENVYPGKVIFIPKD